jgi:hypothetical protein
MTNKLLKTIALGAAIFAGANAFAEGGIEKAVKPAKQENEVIATIALPFSYESQRTEKENNGKLFFYNFLSDGTAYQIDKPNVKFAQRWFWDIDGDGKFGDAEQGAIKDGKLVYMSETFNEKANSEQRKFLQNIENNSQYSSKNLTGKTWGVTGLDDADANGDGDVTPEELNKYYGFDKKIEEAKLLEEKVSQEPTLPKEKVNPTYSLVTGANVNADLDKYNASIGLRVNPFRNENIGLGLNADVGFGLDKKVDIYGGEFSSGNTAYGEVNEKNNQSIGLSAELQLHNFILGGGSDYSTNITETYEEISRKGKILASNTNSIPKGEFYGKGYVGFDFKPTKNWKVGATAGYHGKDGFQFGMRNTIRLNNRR